MLMVDIKSDYDNMYNSLKGLRFQVHTSQNYEWMTLLTIQHQLQNPSFHFKKGMKESISMYIYEKLMLWSIVPCISIFPNLDVIMNAIKNVALIFELQLMRVGKKS